MSSPNIGWKKTTNLQQPAFTAITTAAGFVLILISLLEIRCKNDFSQPPPPGPPWVTFTHQNSPLLDNRINAITFDREGIVWYATDSGASGFKKGSWYTFTDSLSFWVYQNGRPPMQVRTVKSITQAKDGSLWFGLLGGGIVRYDRNSTTVTWQRFNEPTIPYNVVLSLASDHFELGEVWCATLSGVGRFTPSKSDPNQGYWRTYTVQTTPELTTNRIYVVVNNPNDNTIWFGTATGAVASVMYAVDIRWSSLTIPDNRYAVISIAFDTFNNGWFGTAADGAWKLKRQEGYWQHFDNITTGSRLPNGPMNAIAIDSKNTTWFGTNGGLVRLRDTTWTVFTKTNSPLPSDTVTALSFDFKENLWIGTMNGVTAYNEEGTRF